jgi:hypothetical protein
MSHSQSSVQSTIAKVHYTPKSGVTVTAFAHAQKGGSTFLMHEGKKYSNAKEWIEKAFQNSGKNKELQVVEKSVVGTPRPHTRYIPPNKNCPYGTYV